jgi:DNA-binding NarL/FixJ family response regulator
MITKIAITDDHLMVLRGIESMLKATPEVEVVGTYQNATETIENIGKNIPDVLLLDINLPDINGIKLCKQLLETYPELKIIALTSFDELSYVRRILNNGAHGYLSKNIDKIELIKALKTVLLGDLYLQKDIEKRLLNSSFGRKSKRDIVIKLTIREREVLDAIAEELTTAEISDKLCISPKTVETHRMHLLSKFNVKNSVGLIKKAFEKGLLC